MAIGDVLLVYSGVDSYTQATSVGGPASTVEPASSPTLEIDPTTVSGVPAGIELIEIDFNYGQGVLPVIQEVEFDIGTADAVSGTFDIVCTVYYGTYWSAVSASLYIVNRSGLGTTDTVLLAGTNLNILCRITWASLVAGYTYGTLGAKSFDPQAPSYTVGTGRYVSPQQPTYYTYNGNPVAGFRTTTTCGAVSLVAASGCVSIAPGAVSPTLLLGIGSVGITVQFVEYAAGYTSVTLQCRGYNMSGGNTTASKTIEVPVGFSGVKYIVVANTDFGFMAAIQVDFSKLLSTVRSDYSYSRSYNTSIAVTDTIDRVAPPMYQRAYGYNVLVGMYLHNVSESARGVTLYGRGDAAYIYTTVVKDAAYAGVDSTAEVGDGSTTGLLTVAGSSLASLAYTGVAVGSLPAQGYLGFWLQYTASDRPSETERVATALFGVGAE